MPEIAGPDTSRPQGLRIAILGAGALGSFLAARLTEAGLAVQALEVDPARIDAIRRGGLLVEDERGRRTIRLDIRRPQAADEADLLIVVTKAMHTAEALQDAASAIGGQTGVLTLQNGLGAAERIAAILGPDRLLFGVTETPADFTAPNTVRSTGAGATYLWRLADAGSAALEGIAAAMERAGLPAVVTSDTYIRVWEKAAFNAALNAPAAILDCAVGALNSAEGWALIRDVVDEAAAVAHAAGVGIETARVLERIRRALDRQGDHAPSMLQDLRSGRSTEIDVLNGAIARLARAHGLPAPTNEVLARLVRLKTAARATAVRARAYRR